MAFFWTGNQRTRVRIKLTYGRNSNMQLMIIKSNNSSHCTCQKYWGQPKYWGARGDNNWWNHRCFSIFGDARARAAPPKSTPMILLVVLQKFANFKCVNWYLFFNRWHHFLSIQQVRDHDTRFLRMFRSPRCLPVILSRQISPIGVETDNLGEAIYHHPLVNQGRHLHQDQHLCHSAEAAIKLREHE